MVSEGTCPRCGRSVARSRVRNYSLAIAGIQPAIGWHHTLMQISSALDASKQVAEQNRQLKTDLDATKQRLDLLETEIRNQQQATPAQRGTPENTNQNW